MSYKIHVHRVWTDLTHRRVPGYRRKLKVRDFWKYVDIIAVALQRRVAASHERGRDRAARAPAGSASAPEDALEHVLHARLLVLLRRVGGGPRRGAVVRDSQRKREQCAVSREQRTGRQSNTASRSWRPAASSASKVLAMRRMSALQLACAARLRLGA